MLTACPLDGGSGTGEDASFQALHHIAAGQTKLYLSWRINVDSGGINDGQDELFVGFSPNGNEAIIARITVNTTAPTEYDDPTAFNADVFYRSSSSSSWQLFTDAPNWIDTSARMWIDATGQVKWGVNMIVPIGANLLLGIADIPSGASVNLGNTFKMWYTMHVVNPTPTPPSITPHKWPRDAASATEDALTGEMTFPDPGMWGDFRVGTSGSPCVLDVSIEPSNVGTTNTDGSGNPRPHWIELDTHTPRQAVTNTFFVKPRNHRPITDPPVSIPASAISASIRIANWGSQPDWNDVPDPSTLWDEVVSPSDTKHNTSDLPPDDPANPNPDHNLGHIEYQWIMSPGDQDPFFLPPSDLNAKRRHQCMLVQLHGAGFVFMPGSIYRNMSFENASRVSREAEISVRGLEPIAEDSPRDVYLYVETVNMPPPPKFPGRKDRITQPISAASVPIASQQPGNSLDEIAQQMPTYRVHGYHDTGRKIIKNEVTYTVLRPQGSFGYYIRHKDSVAGWRHWLVGAEQIAPNFYWIPVPNDGVETITTTIIPVGGCLWWLWVFAWWILSKLGRNP
jgi:hypothetical protein